MVLRSRGPGYTGVVGKEDTMKDERTLMQRYQDAIRDLGYASLLALPDPIKNMLKETTELEKKVRILEKLAKEFEGT